MARLLNFPRIAGLSLMQPLSGSRAVGAVSNESITGFVQTTASAFGTQRWQFTIPFARDAELRRIRGMIKALHGGANAVRITFVDPDRSLEESGVVGSTSPVRWSNGMSWSNGCDSSITPPVVSISNAASANTDVIRLANSFWGSSLDIGDWLGFMPFHFGLYEVTEVIASRQYRIWPPLRKDIATTDYATLQPVMVMRLESENSASWSRDPVGAKDISLTLVEVQDSDVRDYFTA